MTDQHSVRELCEIIATGIGVPASADDLTDELAARAALARLEEQKESYDEAVERLRLLTLGAATKETPDRDTYVDGYAAGLSQALRMVRVDIASYPASDSDA